MKEYSGIAVTDQINRYNEIFSLHAMYSAYNMQWNEIFPSFANHDHTKCIGISQLTGLFLEPKRAYTTNKLIIGENDEDYNLIKKYNYNFLYKTCVTDRIEKYKTLEDSIRAYSKGNTVKYWTNAVFIYNKGIVERMFPELTNEISKGLINIKLLESVLPGVYKYNGYLIFAHRYFRRGFSYLNTLNTAFLERIERLSKDNSELDIKIAIDLDCIGLSGSEHKEFEYQYWWGPKFNNSLNDIPLGVTRHINEHYNELLSNVQFVDFGWYLQDNKHTFECEEVTDIPNMRINEAEMYGCRFIHSMVDQSGYPVHLDGAIRAYDTEKMIERVDISIKDCERDTLYTKLWRIDGQINVEKWKELITHYYRDNMTVGEYFGGEDEKICVIKETDEKVTGASLKDYIPCSLNSGDGLRVFFSFINPFNTDWQKDIIIIPTFSIYEDNVLKNCIEIESIDFYKLLLRKGFCVELKSENMISFDDTVYNYPIFACKDLETANSVLEYLQIFCQTWQERGDDRIISISIRVNYSKRIGNFSIIGHVDDFIRFLNTDLKKLPEEENIYEWLQSTYDYITDHSENTCTDHPFVLLKQNKVLGIERCYIPPEKIENISADGLELKLTQDEQKTMDENHISPCCVWKIEKQICTKCEKNYSQCNCIRDVDKDVYTRIEKAKGLGLFWTNRSAYYI